MKSGVVKNLMLVISTNNCHGKRFIREELKNTWIRPLKNMQKKNADVFSPNWRTCANTPLNLTVAKLFKIRESPLLHCFDNLPKKHWRDLMTDINPAIGLSTGKINHKFALKQENLKLTKKEKVCLFN